MNHADTLLAGRGLTVTRVLRETGHSTTAACHTADGTAAVVKSRSGSGGAYLRQRHDTERAVYAGLADNPPGGLRTARLLDADEHTLVLEQLPGSPLGTARYPGRLSRRTTSLVLDALDALHGWKPANTLPQWPRTRVLDYLTAIDGSPLTPADRALAEQLAESVGELRIEHRDPLPSNFLTDGDHLAVIDFEHTGWHPPGTDWALLDLLWSPANPWLRPILHHRAHIDRAAAGYALALLVYAAHEHHLHRVLFAPGQFEQRRELLEDNITYARQRARTAAQERP